ncbi:transporter substrate-binding domain-containing protein [Pantoea sp. DY-15]|uniref:transporter substrate-binding domain-containing protein n=1 Tax=unclassified Pantoea TaxID=2630326 RepID=UPI001C9605CA|nr:MULTISPECIES: transporter substrate-binding domain-containing protein [unclassified Pantoea]MBY4839771.1 transporter substrate-binding domain-containing protein [Pantoea sp. DY-5]MBY4888606.1 transporter substrate-binding domain-containing protein [Pantoea sp. DY-15]
MMMRKGLFTASVGMLLIASSALVQAKDFGTLKFATEAAYPPFNQSTPNGKIVGYEPDMVAEIAKRAGFKYEIVAQKWSGMIPGLVDGKYDAVIDAVTVTPKREEVVDFSRQYTVSVSGFVTLKGSAVDTLPGNGEVVLADDEAAMTKSIDALKAKFKGKTIAVQVATIQADFLNKYLADVATIRTYQAGPETFADLLNGRVDAVMASRTNLNAYVKKHADTVNSTGYGFSGGVLGQGSAIAIQKNNPELKEALDSALNSMIKDGTLKQLSEKWFGENVAPKE